MINRQPVKGVAVFEHVFGSVDMSSRVRIETEVCFPKTFFLNGI